jgi:hypothetical protein
MEKLQWFKFSHTDWIMGKIQRCPEITQARFVRLCCLYWNKETNLSVKDAIIEIDEEHFNILISKSIIKKDEEHIFIEFLDVQYQSILETSKKAKKAVETRWKKAKNSNTSVIQNDTNVLQSNNSCNTDKIREDKIREDKTIPSIDEFVAYALSSKPNVNIENVKLKYNAWLVNNWKINRNGKDVDIKNWKTTLLNTIPHLGEKELDLNRFKISI